MAERLYSLQQTADLLGTSVTQVRGWIASSRLPAEQAAGRIWISERGLVQFLTDRGIDLSAILEGAGHADRPPPRDAPPAQPSTAADADAAGTDAASTGRRGFPCGDAVSRLAEAILHDALRRGADAIYLEPVPGSLTLKLRVGDRLREKPRFASRLPQGLGPRLLARFRAMGHLAESGGHEAAFSVPVGGRAQAFRIEESPTADGPGLAIYPVEPR